MKKMNFLLRATMFTFCMVVIFAIPFQTVASADQCASFDFGTGILNIPCFELQGYSYWLDLSLVPNDTALLFQLTNFGSNSDCQDDDVKNGIYRSCNYFPFKAGNTWVYSYGNTSKSSTVTSGTHSFSQGTGKRLTNFNDPCSEEDIFADQSENGFEVYGIYDRDEEKYLELPVGKFKMLPNEMRVGDSWSQTQTDGEVTNNFIGIETVTVQAGTFLSCLKIQMNIVKPGKGSYSNLLWYAKNVGIVKIQRISESPVGYMGCWITNSKYPLVELEIAWLNGISYP